MLTFTVCSIAEYTYNIPFQHHSFEVAMWTHIYALCILCVQVMMSFNVH